MKKKILITYHTGATVNWTEAQNIHAGTGKRAFWKRVACRQEGCLVMLRGMQATVQFIDKDGKMQRFVKMFNAAGFSITDSEPITQATYTNEVIMMIAKKNKKATTQRAASLRKTNNTLNILNKGVVTFGELIHKVAPSIQLGEKFVPYSVVQTFIKTLHKRYDIVEKKRKQD